MPFPIFPNYKMNVQDTNKNKTRNLCRIRFAVVIVGLTRFFSVLVCFAVFLAAAYTSRAALVLLDSYLLTATASFPSSSHRFYCSVAYDQIIICYLTFCGPEHLLPSFDNPRSCTLQYPFPYRSLLHLCFPTARRIALPFWPCLLVALVFSLLLLVYLFSSVQFPTVPIFYISRLLTVHIRQ